MFDPEDFVRFCQAAVNTPNAPVIIYERLLRVVASPTEITPPPGDNREAWRLYQSPSLTILHTTYPRGLRTPAHNHGAWAVVSVYRGREDNVRYARSGSNLSVLGCQSIHPGEAVLLDPEEIHDLSTSSDEPTCSIHVYGRDLYDHKNHSMWVPPMLEERPYDEQEFVRHSIAMTRNARGLTSR